MTSARDEQSAYYERTGADYDEAHVLPGDEHFISLEYVAGLLETVQASNLLDVGSGTGRAVRFLRSRRPELDLTGLEPSAELHRQAEAHGGGTFVLGSGEALPFPDDTFDVVLATAVLHHVPEPKRVVAEMCRVARKAVFISDANRFGQGSRPERLVKVALDRAGLLRTYNTLRTRGKGYFISEGDGVFYSYSIFDSLDQLNAWGDRTFVIPTSGRPSTANGPLLQAGAGLLVAVREPCRDDWAGTGTFFG